MRTAIIGCILLLASTPAFADPCEVTISRAPDDVRATIEAWVAAEPSCSTTADIRVVATDGGYYLLAIGSDGRVHERVVPDAQSAGVLVASWIAEDGAPVTTSAPAPAPAPVVVATAPPIPAETPAPMVETTVTAEDAAGRWLTVGPTIVLVDHGLAGLRATVDLKRWRRWSLGASAAVATIQEDVSVTTLRGIVEGAYTRTRGAWSVRLAFGVGGSVARYTTPSWDGFSPEMTTTTSGPVWEGSALVSRRFRDRWAVTAGPIVDGPMSEELDVEQLRYVTLFAGLSRSF